MKRLCGLALALFVFGFASSEAKTSKPVSNDQVSITINIPGRSLTLFQNGNQVYKFPIAVGQPVFKTPTGGGKSINQVIWNPSWMPPPNSAWGKDYEATPPGSPNNPLGPVKMQLGKYIFLHGTSNEQTIGTAASHGCIRMFNKDAITLAWWLQSNFSRQTDPSLLNEYQAQKDKSIFVSLNRSIPVDITYQLFDIVSGKLQVHPDLYSQSQNKKEAIIAWLKQMGYDNSKVDYKLLDRLLAMSDKQTSQVTLKQLLSAKKPKTKEKKPAEKVETPAKKTPTKKVADKKQQKPAPVKPKGSKQLRASI